MTGYIPLSQDDTSLVLLLSASAGCSLNSSPGTNWVEKSGGLPNYICEIAKSVMKTGKSKSSAIAIAVSRVKKWAAGGDDVKADTKAKAAKALAQWEALKAKNKAKKLSLAQTDDGVYLMFSNVPSFNTEQVRSAWDNIQRDKRNEARSAARLAGLDPYDTTEPYSYVKELWTDHLIVQVEGVRSAGDSGNTFLRVPYTVSDDTVDFGEPTEVKQVWEDSDTLDDDELEMLADLLLAAPVTASDRILRLSHVLRS